MKSSRPGSQLRSQERKTLDLQQTRNFAMSLLGEDLHAKRVLSLANGVVGVLHAAMLGISAIGQAYAKVAGIQAKSGTKQVDRLLSNQGVSLEVLFRAWVRFVVGPRAELVVALDWTEFDKDDHSTLCAYLVTRHGRATPMIWKTVQKSQLKNARSGIEFDLLSELDGYLPASAEKVTVLADRGFGSTEFYAHIAALGWDYVIRFRGCIVVEDAKGQKTKPAEEWLSASGRAKKLVGPRVTRDLFEVPAVVVVKAKKMADAWFLATSLKDARASEVVKLYGKRWSIETTFRDTKDLHFGMGLSATHIRNAQRRDRLMFLLALAHALLTLLGAASERAEFDKMLKSNTSKKRTHSLYRQGHYYYHAIPYMREDWLQRLMAAFDEVVREHEVFEAAFGAI